ncbi:hypothetical protein P7K49_004450, partial [Saguinus oedipus]
MRTSSDVALGTWVPYLHPRHCTNKILGNHVPALTLNLDLSSSCLYFQQHCHKYMGHYKTFLNINCRAWKKNGQDVEYLVEATRLGEEIGALVIDPGAVTQGRGLLLRECLGKLLMETHAASSWPHSKIISVHGVCQGDFILSVLFLYCGDLINLNLAADLRRVHGIVEEAFTGQNRQEDTHADEDRRVLKPQECSERKKNRICLEKKAL